MRRLKAVEDRRQQAVDVGLGACDANRAGQPFVAGGDSGSRGKSRSTAGRDVRIAEDAALRSARSELPFGPEITQGVGALNIPAEPLRASSFAPFGDVLEAPRDPGRAYFDASLGSSRSGAAPSVSVAHVEPLARLPLAVTRMERHEFSSQSFVPLHPCRWLVIVAPKLRAGGPDIARVRAFLAGPGQGITYRADTWHHPLSVLDRPARFAIFMWLDGSNADEEFVTLDQPFVVDVSS
jgi:ureidoglycolate lyase